MRGWNPHTAKCNVCSKAGFNDEGERKTQEGPPIPCNIGAYSAGSTETPDFPS